MNDFTNIRLNGTIYTAGTIHRFSEMEPGESWRAHVVQFLDEWFNQEESIEVQTSGSTGAPKIIRLSKQSMVNSARMTCAFFDLKAGDTALLCLPASHIAGKMMLVRAMVAGFNLLAVKPEGNPFTGLPPVVDFAAITPFQLSRSYQALQDKTLRKLIVGGGPVSLKLQKLIENLDTEIYETYGMTETCSHVAFRRLNGGAAADCFTVLPGVEIRRDERNCLIISAPALTGSEIITNDVVEMLGNNQFRWLGRFDHVINSGGVKLFPEAMEQKLEPFLDRRFFIGSLPHDELGEKVVLVIEGAEFNEPESAKLYRDIKIVLTPFEMPRSIHFIEAFDTSSAGKVLKSGIMRKILNAEN